MSLRIYLIAAVSLKGGMEQFLSDRKLKWDRQSLQSDAESLVEAAGRICYLSFGARQHRRDNAEYICNLIKKGHESVLEHANFTLLVDGISRALSHQLVRHRIGFAYSQLSQQYKDEVDAEFVQPGGLERDPKSLERWKAFIREAQSVYRELLQYEGSDDESLSKAERHRWRRSVARSVLPNATSTTLMVTGNARAWRHLLDVRGSISGDLEMREYCAMVFETLVGASPSLFAGYEVVGDELGAFVRKTKSVE
jgi:thymidylate synthase (FAD)